MKRLLIGMFALILTGNIATAQTISVSDIEALPGETVSFAVDLAGGKANTYTAFQFRLSTDATGISVVDCEPSGSWKKATGVAADMGSEGYTNFASSEAIAEANVDGLVSVQLKIDETVAVGTYVVTLSDAYFAYGTIAESHRDYVDDISFKVNVVAAHTVILDETSLLPPVAANGVVAVVNRTINADELSTIVLPFEMAGSQVHAAFGDDVELFDFAGYDAESDVDGNIVAITINFITLNADDGIQANHPYAIRVKHDVTSFTVEGVDITPADNPTVAAVKRTNKRWSELIGTYTADTTVPSTDIFLSENKFWYSVGLTKMKAFRAYFEFYDVITEVEDAYSIKMRFDSDGDASSISAVNASAGIRTETTYDMNGRRQSGIQRGINIVDGKKVYVVE